MKRFWSDVTVIEAGRGWQVALDGRPLKTQGGAAQIVPSEGLAQALAEEWRAQGEEIDSQGFAFRDMADYAIDAVRADRASATNALLAFAQTDTLCYRADPEDALYRRQQEVWEPLVAAFEAREAVSLPRISGILHRAPAEATLARLRQRLEGLDDFTLASLQSLASLSASLCTALSALQPDSNIEALWDAANLEEDWQADLWGRDEEAETRRAARKDQFAIAGRFAKLAGGKTAS